MLPRLTAGGSKAQIQPLLPTVCEVNLGLLLHLNNLVSRHLRTETYLCKRHGIANLSMRGMMRGVKELLSASAREKAVPSACRRPEGLGETAAVPSLPTRRPAWSGLGAGCLPQMQRHLCRKPLSGSNMCVQIPLILSNQSVVIIQAVFRQTTAFCFSTDTHIFAALRENDLLRRLQSCSKQCGCWMQLQTLARAVP